MRTLALTAALFLLTSCGFEPVHAKRYGASQQTIAGLESVAIEVHGTRGGGENNRRVIGLLEAELNDQFNPDYIRAPKRYVLKVFITETVTSVFINPDGTSSRNDVSLASTFSLTPIDGQKPVRSGSISRVSSYNVSERADYATYVAEEDARKRGVVELARAYKLRIANVLGTLDGTP